MQLKRRKKIVFIGHEASLSGAPVLLLNLLLLLKELNEFEIVLVIKRYGPFLKEFEKHFQCIVLKGEHYGKEGNFAKRIQHILLNRWQLIKVIFYAGSAHCVFSNTITNGRILKILSPFRKKIITYVHELEKVIEWYMRSGDSQSSIKYSRKFAYPSASVGKTLVDKYKIDQKNICRLNYYFPIQHIIINDSAAKEVFKLAFKKKFGLEQGFIVGNMGVLCERKGADLFIEVCSSVVSSDKNIKFCWIGSFENEQTERDLKQLILSKNLGDNIVLTGPLPHHNYNTVPFDLLFLSSREDPYPLVVLEAAFMKVPAICFEKAGGISEFVEGDAGWIVDGFSIAHSATAIIDIFNKNRETLEQKGNAAFTKAMALHANKDIVLKQFGELLNDL